MAPPDRLCALLLFNVAVCTSAGAPVDPYPWLDPALKVTERVEKLLDALTLVEKCSLMDTDNPAIPRLKLPQYGWWSEAAHGVAWAGRATVFPASIGMAATFDVDLVSNVGTAIGFEGRAKFNDYFKRNNGSKSLFGLSFFAPNINIVRDVRWGRGQETYGEDPYLTSQLAVAVITGMQNKSHYGESYPLVGATAKHFFAYNLESNFAKTPLFPNGGTDGQYRLLANVNVTETDLVQTYFPAFDAAVEKAEVRSIMCSYNAINGIPACGHPKIQQQLRGADKFGGYVVSDCGAITWMGPPKHNYTANDMESGAVGVKAGTDLDCGGVYNAWLAKGVAAGLLTEKDIDMSLTRTLSTRIELGLLDPPGTNPLQDIGMEVVDSKQHRALALKAAVESLVLVKNKNGVLPLKPNAHVALIGPNANRSMTLLSNYPGCKNTPGGPIDPTCTIVNPLQGMTTQAKLGGGSLMFAQGSQIDGNDTSMIAEAVSLAADARVDVVVMCIGLITCQEKGEYCQEAEAKDRVDITLPDIQQQLMRAVAAAGKPIVLVVFGGGTVAIPWAAQTSEISAIVQAWYPGEEGGTAIAKVLYGEENPSGRLPETIFTSLAQLPYNYLSMTMMDTPGRTHRYFTDTPLYNFGFGMSYDERVYSDLKFSHNIITTHETVTVSVVVACVAGTGGVEVVQLYTSLETNTPSARSQGKRSIPLRELKGFKRVSVPHCGAREAGVKVAFRLSANDLALVDTDGVLRPIPGTYTVWVGGVGPVSGLYTSEYDAAVPLQGSITIPPPSLA